MSKYSRIGRSSSQGELGMFRPIDYPPAFFEKKRPTPHRNSKSAAKKLIKHSQPPTKKKSECIFTVGSPEREKRDDRKSKIKKPAEGFGEFLENCFLCKKKLQKDFYMYGYLGAFCTPQCREDQMALDGFEQQMAKEMAERLKTAGTLFTPNTSKLSFRR